MQRMKTNRLTAATVGSSRRRVVAWCGGVVTGEEEKGGTGRPAAQSAPAGSGHAGSWVCRQAGVQQGRTGRLARARMHACMHARRQAHRAGRKACARSALAHQAPARERARHAAAPSHATPEEGSRGTSTEGRKPGRQHRSEGSQRRRTQGTHRERGRRAHSRRGARASAIQRQAGHGSGSRLEGLGSRADTAHGQLATEP